MKKEKMTDVKIKSDKKYGEKKIRGEKMNMTKINKRYREQMMAVPMIDIMYLLSLGTNDELKNSLFEKMEDWL
jgi:hypothetical protein